MPSVGIIGTAGRNGAHMLMNKETFVHMCEKAKEIITKEFKLSWKDVHLVSGGAAWADHVAVELFLENVEQGTTVTLHMPCEWKDNEIQFEDNKIRDWRQNPGHTANHLHKLFSERTGKETLKEIQQAKEKGAEITVSKGFHARNTKISKAEYIIALSSGKDQPESGGTLDTWNKSKGIKAHTSKVIEYPSSPFNPLLPGRNLFLKLLSGIHSTFYLGAQ